MHEPFLKLLFCFCIQKLLDNRYWICFEQLQTNYTLIIDRLYSNMEEITSQRDPYLMITIDYVFKL